MRRAMRLLKGIAWCLSFTALCAAATLAVMRQIAVRGGRGGLYAEWIGEIGEAIDEARTFVGDCWKKTGREADRVLRGGAR